MSIDTTVFLVFIWAYAMGFLSGQWWNRLGSLDA
jgi:hypothetical protein